MFLSGHLPFVEHSNFTSEGRRQQNKHQCWRKFTPSHPGAVHPETSWTRTERALKEDYALFKKPVLSSHPPAGHNIWLSDPQAQDK